MLMRQQEISQIQETVYRERIKALFTTIALRRRYREQQAFMMQLHCQQPSSPKSPLRTRRQEAAGPGRTAAAGGAAAARWPRRVRRWCGG